MRRLRPTDLVFGVHLLAATSVLIGCDEDSFGVLPCDPANEDCLTCEDALMELNPSSVELSSEGDPVMAPLTVWNAGTCELRLGDVEFATEGGPFRCVGCDRLEGLTINPAESATVSIVFAPTTIGFEENVLQIESNDVFLGGDVIRIPVRGLNNGRAILGTPEGVSFGRFDLSSRGDLPTRLIDLRNEGTGTALLEIQELRIEPAGSPFRIIGEQPSPAGSIELAAPNPDGLPSVLTTELVYNPQQRAAHAAELLVTTNLEPTPRRVRLDGTALGPAVCEIEPNTLDFGTVTVGDLKTSTIDLVNRGESPLSVELALRAGTEAERVYSMSPSRLIVQPNQRGQVSVSFSPTAQTTVLANVLVSAADEGTDLSKCALALTGQGDDQQPFLRFEATLLRSGSVRDIRRVDLLVENATQPGVVVSEASPEADWGDAGEAKWLPFGTLGTTRRVGITRLNNPSEYVASVEYLEDCADFPLEEAARITGLLSDVILAALGASNMTIGGRLEDLINRCQSSPATVVVEVQSNRSISGSARREVRLTRQTEIVRGVLRVRFENGGFVVQ